MEYQNDVLSWLMQRDSSIHWQVLRDVLGSGEEKWRPIRNLVETEGWGARLLSHQDSDGQWAGGAFAPKDFDWSAWESQGQPWTATCFSLTQLRDFGLDPASESACRTIKLLRQNARWEEGGQPYWDGEIEECINGRTLADGAYFRVDVSSIVERLVCEIQPDGGWNCERCNGSLRSSFASTINVLEGLLEFEKVTGGTRASKQARLSGEEFLLNRHLFRRLTTGEVADEKFLQFIYPHRWRYDILRALDYFRSSSLWTEVTPDLRLEEAIEHLRRKRALDGTWHLDWQNPGRVWFNMDGGPGTPSAWITLKALRILKWWNTH